VAAANVFVLGMSEENLRTLREVPYAEDVRFRRLLTMEELQYGEISVPDLLRAARRTLDAFDGRIDAVVGFWDFPVSTLAPVLCAEYGLRGTSLESVVKCEHKYWSRLEQQKVTDAHPAFALVDLDGEPVPPRGVRYPMWLKPVKSFSSELAYGVSDDAEFQDAFAAIRDGVARVGKPFEDILDLLDLPPEIEAAGGQTCIAEEALSGDQVAVEGYVSEGRVTVYGVLDSHCYPGSSSFLRHQYPSALPGSVTARLTDISRRVVTRIGLDSVTFSIEFFHDPGTGAVGILEINPRHSQSHAELFHYVDGVPNHHCLLALALGRDPRLPRRAGPYRLAAMWYHRRFDDALVRRVPAEEEVRALERRVPGTRIDVRPRAGHRLSEMEDQDSYSYELAHVFTGADSETELREKYRRCVDGLDFAFEETRGEETRRCAS
jgi:hypothetical protein